MQHYEEVKALIDKWKKIEQKRERLCKDIVSACVFERDYGYSVNTNIYDCIIERLESCNEDEIDIINQLVTTYRSDLKHDLIGNDCAIDNLFA